MRGRPIKQNADYFKIRYQSTALRLAYIKGGRRLLNYIRQTSSAFIARKDVRKFVFQRDSNKCIDCFCSDKIQIDHIKSVWKFCCSLNLKTCDETDIQKILYEINSIDNLQTLCRGCNSQKGY